MRDDPSERLEIMETKFKVALCRADGVVTCLEVLKGDRELVTGYPAPVTRKELQAMVRALGRYGKVVLVDDGGEEYPLVGKIVGAQAKGKTLAHMSVGPAAGYNGFEPPIESQWETLVLRTGKGQIVEVDL